MKDIKKKVLITIPLCLTLFSCSITPVNSPVNNSGFQSEGFNFKIQAENNNADWMANMPEVLSNRALREVVIPGTHDSGTNLINENSEFARDNFLDTTLSNIEKITNAINKIIRNKNQTLSFKKVISAWSRSQSLSIYDQLNQGIRYLDLRVIKKSNGEMFITHGMYSYSMDTVINDIKTFITAHPKEIIILDFNHLYDMKNNHENLFNKLNDAFTISGKNRMVPNTETINTKIGKLWENGQQIIAIYDDKDTVSKHSELWSQNTIFSPWANKQDFNELKSSLQNILDGKLFNNQKHNFDCKNQSYCEKISKDKFFVLQGIQTPDAKVLINNLSLFYSLKSAENNYNDSKQSYEELSKKHTEAKTKYDNANFFLKPFYAIELGTLYSRKELMKNRFINAEAEYKKVLAKYQSSTNSLKDLAAKTTPYIRDLIKGEWSNKDLNIIITDWFETTDIVEVIKQLNRNKII